MTNSEHRKYWKIRRLWVPETDGILEWECIIQEKIDGCNVSIWYDWDKLMIWSRNQILSEEQEESWQFSELRQYIEEHEWIKNLISFFILQWNEEVRLYWEWLVRHTIWDYSPEAYNHFYLFDIFIDWEFLDPFVVAEYAEDLKIKRPELFGVTRKPTQEYLNSYVWKTTLWAKQWEGIVIKNHNFVNKFWDRVYAKIVSENFKEENATVFGNHQAWDNEMKICVKFVTDWRIRKIINKIEQNYDKEISMKDIKQIIWMTYQDIVTEELSYIMKQWVIDFRRLSKLCWNRIAKVAIWVITGEPVSVAFNQ